MNPPVLDLIAIGRSSVDLYGQQVGGRLEDMSSFSKAVGGCPTNIAIGSARLGLRSGLVTRVGDEHMGRFIREHLVREGVDVNGVKTDPSRLTSIVVLGIRDDKTFPLVFYRSDCADGALDESDIDESYIASARAIVVTGTHFSRPNTAAAQKKAMRIARAHGRRIIFDVDYRPNLWGLAGHGAGEERYIRSENVTAHLRPILPDCDLIVGTEEELMIAGGKDDPLAAVRAVRDCSSAVIVMKRGPMGCVVFPGPIPADIEDGVKGPGFPVEVYNVLGAGDAFMSGFLRGWLRDEPLELCCTYANAAGAFAVSRLLCSVEYPSFAEMAYFIQHGSSQAALRKDETINRLHWTTTRDRLTSFSKPGKLIALAIDHRAQLEAIADEVGASRERINEFKGLAVDAAVQVAAGRSGFGMLLDGTYGRQALFKLADHDFWIGRPVEEPGARTLEFEGHGSLGAKLVEWPVNHTIKCLCFYHPNDADAVKQAQERELLRVFDAARKLGRELLIEIIASKRGPIDHTTTASVLERLYDIGIAPDWWKLEPQPGAIAWDHIEKVIDQRDPACRGIVLLGLEASEDQLAAAFREAAHSSRVKGFAVGRTIFAEPARAWLAGRIDDREAVQRMASSFARLERAWETAVGSARQAKAGGKN